MLDRITQAIHLAPIAWSKRCVTERRRFFYECILAACSDPLDPASILMGQDRYYVPADTSDVVLAPDMGLLVMHIKAKFHGLECFHTYSLYQLGDVLKVGLLLPQQLEKAFLTDFHGEVRRVWNGHKYEQSDRDGTTLYEWTFTVPNLYRSWIDQEAFVLGMRHCHQRVLRVFHDYALSLLDAPQDTPGP